MPIPLSSRLTVASLTVALALPLGAAACGVRLLGNLGGDGAKHGLSSWIVWPGFFIVGLAWIYEVGSRITGGQIDRHRFSMGAVASGTMLGLLVGVWLADISVVLMPVGLALAGAFIGTYVGKGP